MEIVTKNELVQCFQSTGIHRGSVLEVHSSLSSFGQVEGGADTVIDALITSVGDEGSIFIHFNKNALLYFTNVHFFVVRLAAHVSNG